MRASHFPHYIPSVGVLGATARRDGVGTTQMMHVDQYRRQFMERRYRRRVWSRWYRLVYRYWARYV